VTRALRVVAATGSEPEAELLIARLSDAGIAALAQRSIGGPEWGASGGRYVYVSEDDYERAREVLEGAGEAADDSDQAS
jgi:Putative prokaryotic signal transducing protein